MKIFIRTAGTFLLLCFSLLLMSDPLSMESLPTSLAQVSETSQGDLSMAAAGPAEPLTEESLSLEEALNQLAGEDAPPSQSPPVKVDFVPCTIGLLTYYNQSDPRWADTLYGPTDPMRSHGCGPTAIAMIVSSYTGTQLTPPEAAQWASDNGYCSQGEGSRHSLIPDGLTHYGLKVTSLQDRSTEAVLDAVQNGKIVIALMNRGHFTNGGHFLLLTQVMEDGSIRIADPASEENSSKTWDPNFILSEVRIRAEAGGPLWAVEIPEN